LLIGRYDLADGKSVIGSDVSNSVALPQHAPKIASTLERRGSVVTFAPAPGVNVTLNGKRMSGRAVLKVGATGAASDKLAFGDFQLPISETGGQYQVPVRDRQSHFAKEFKGLEWFPVNSAYRVEGKFTAYAEPEELKMMDTGGRTRTRKAPGTVSFQLNGETVRLEPIEIDNVLFFMFKDRTSGRETYGAGRFLDADLPKNGMVVMDFNKAYNPYCVYNPYVSCPIPQSTTR
jgi:uncharacterized protein (DUF1684 family)